MSAEFATGFTFQDNVAPNDIANAANLNGAVNNATLQPGAITNRPEITVTAGNDYVLAYDATDQLLKKIQLTNLLPDPVRTGTQNYAGGTQTGGVYAVTLSPAPAAYAAGMVVRFLADSANTGAVSVNVNALGNKNIFTRALAALQANDILANQIVELVYDGTRFLMLSAISASEVLATHCIEALRYDAQQYIADSGVAANVYAATLAPAATTYTTGMVVRFKANNTNTGASTLNVNALGTKTIKRPNGADLQANDILSGQLVEVVFDGTNFQLIGVRSPDFVGTGAVPATSAATAIAHGLGAKPSRWRVLLMNNTAAADQSYAQNDEVDINGTSNSSNNNMSFTVSVDATNVTVARTGAGNVQVIPKTGGAPGAITTANWLVKVYASL